MLVGVTLGVFDGDMGTEKFLHEKFSALRVNGEWFKNDQRIFDIIKKETKRAIEKELRQELINKKHQLRMIDFLEDYKNICLKHGFYIHGRGKEACAVNLCCDEDSTFNNLYRVIKSNAKYTYSSIMQLSGR